MTIEDRAHREIRRIAYEIWEREGRPEGRDREHWEMAKEMWAFQHSEETETATDKPEGTRPGASAAGRSASS